MDTEKKALMFAQVEKWRESGKTIREYSESIGVSKGKFEYWVKKVRTTNKCKTAPVNFVELMTPVKDENCEAPSSPKAQIELIFPGGLCLKIYA